MIDASKKVALYATGTAILSITACTMVMNAKFGWTQGHDELEKSLFVVAGLSMDLIKVFGLIFIVQAWQKRSWLKALTGSVIWAVCVLYGLMAASGFALTGRTNVNAEQTFSNDTLSKAKGHYDELFRDLKTLKTEQDTMKTNQRYLSTAGCTVPEARMTVESRYFCTQYFTHLDKISQKAKEVETAKSNVPADSYQKPIDPQMAFLASVFQIPMQNMLQRWAVGIAIAFELISAFGMYSISPTRRQSTRSASNEQSQEEVDELPEDAAPVKRGPGRPKGSKNKPKLATSDGVAVAV